MHHWKIAVLFSLASVGLVIPAPAQEPAAARLLAHAKAQYAREAPRIETSDRYLRIVQRTMTNAGRVMRRNPTLEERRAALHLLEDAFELGIRVAGRRIQKDGIIEMGRAAEAMLDAGHRALAGQPLRLVTATWNRAEDFKRLGRALESFANDDRSHRQLPPALSGRGLARRHHESAGESESSD